MFMRSWSDNTKKALTNHRRKSYDKLDMLKHRDVTLPEKVHIVKAVFFQVISYGCESWTIKKAEH